MKRTILTLFLAIISIGTLAQDLVNPAPGKKRVYCEIRGYNPNVLGVGTSIRINVNFGEKQNWFGNDDRDRLLDENDKQINFKSMVDAMNYMSERGWVYRDSYISNLNGQMMIVYLLFKDVENDEQIKDGIKQKRDKNKKSDNKDDIYN